MNSTQKKRVSILKILYKVSSRLTLTIIFLFCFWNLFVKSTSSDLGPENNYLRVFNCIVFCIYHMLEMPDSKQSSFLHKIRAKLTVRKNKNFIICFQAMCSITSYSNNVCFFIRNRVNRYQKWQLKSKLTLAIIVFLSVQIIKWDILTVFNKHT